MTGLTSNIDELIQHFKALAGQTQEIDVSQALLAGVNAAASEMRFRIFNEGKDVEGDLFGQYAGHKNKFSPKQKLTVQFKKKLSNSRIVGPQNQSGEDFNLSEYEIIRLRAGRQIRYKDLEFTGSLRRGIVPVNNTDTSSVISKTRVICAIPNNQLFLIAGYQEEQIGRIKGTGRVVIFAASVSEKETMKENVTETIKQLYVRFFNTK